jgi:hypothetical protein
MNWEALTALSTAFTGLIILLTVIFAARQVRALNEQSRALSAQLEHLRRATQLDGTLAVFDELFSPDLQQAYRFVMTEFQDRMQDESFRTEALARAPDAQTHLEVYILRHLERIGTLVKNDLLDADPLLDFAGFFFQELWERLGPLALEQRQRYGNERLWENFEFIADLANRAAQAKSLGKLRP